MTQAILFPDVEVWAINYLSSALAPLVSTYAYADAYVANALPQTRRPRQVIVRRDGGPRLDLVRDAARLTVRVYGRNDGEAAELAALVRALLGAAADGSTPVVRVRELAGPLPVPDANGQPDYRLMTVEVTVKGTPLV